MWIDEKKSDLKSLYPCQCQHMLYTQQFMYPNGKKIKLLEGDPTGYSIQEMAIYLYITFLHKV